MAFDGFGGAGGHLAQQLEVARHSGTEPVFGSSVGGPSLSVSTLGLLTVIINGDCFVVYRVCTLPGVYLTVKVNSIFQEKKNSP